MDPLDGVQALSALDDPTRRRVYEYVSAQGRPVGRDETASALGVGRTLAAYHLDRLAAGGLLTVAYERRSGRTGPGSGRPAKMYDRARDEVSVSLPPRDYGVAAHLLAHAAAHDEHGATRRALREAAASLGHEIAAEHAAADSPGPDIAAEHAAADSAGPDIAAEGPDDLEPLLRARGYEPFHDEDGVMRLRNCPFHAVAQRYPAVVCEMNLALLGGLVAGRDVEAVLEPAPGRCCVAIRGRRA